MIDVTVTLNDAEAKQFVINAGRKIDDTTKPMAQAMMHMVRSVRQNFLAQGRPVEWKPLSPLTIALRRKGRTKGMGGPRILRDTGTLYNSIQPGRAGSLSGVINKGEARVGTNLLYAPLHQFGGLVKTPELFIEPKRKYSKRPRKMLKSGKTGKRRLAALRFEVDGKEVYARSVHIPSRAAWVTARPFMMFQIPEDIDRIQRIFDQHIGEAIKKELEWYPPRQY